MKQRRLVFMDSGSILVVGARGRMRQLFVPIPVKNISPESGLPIGVIVYVDAIREDEVHRICYWIHQRWYPYYFFLI